MAKPRAIGADAVQLIGFEAVYGTPPAGGGGQVYYRLPMRSDDISSSQPLEDDDSWNRETPDDGDASLGAETTAGELVSPIDARGAGVLLRAALGAPTSEEVTEDELWEHVFVSGLDLPSISKQVGHPKLQTPKWRTQFGGKVDTLGFELSRTGRAVLTLGMIFQGEQKDNAGARDADPLSFAYLPFDNCKASVKLGGVQIANLTGGNVSFSNSLDTVETIRADNRIDGADETIRKASGSATIRLGNDPTIDDLVDSGGYAALEFGFALPSQPDWFLKFQFPRVRFERSKKAITGPGGIEQPVNWRASHDTAEGHLMQVLLRNDVPAYVV